jgi:hypothetical protein
MIEGRDHYLHKSLINVKVVDWKKELFIPLRYRVRKVMRCFLSKQEIWEGPEGYVLDSILYKVENSR